jgi:signal transduction histidine kinase
MNESAPRSLMQRIMASFAILVTAVAAFYAVALYRSMAFTESELVAGILEDEMTRSIVRLERNTIPHLPPGMKIYGPAPLEPVPPPLHALPEGYSEVTDYGDLFTYCAEWRGHKIVLVRDQEGFEDIERTFKLITLVSVVIVGLFGLLAGWWLSRNIMKPVRELSAAVREASESSVYKPLAVTPTDDEVGELARICDEALKRLHGALEREKAFTGDVSHELRTPLTVIETSAEMLEMTELTDEQEKQLARIRRETAAMQELIELFLSFARYASGQGGYATAKAGEALAETAATWRPFAEEKGLSLTLKKEAECPEVVPKVFLLTLAGNLVKNAVAYTDEGGVEIAETAEGFRVSDTGPGIRSDEAERIFERGGRGSAADRNPQGHGLGLSMARRICKRFGWELSLLPSERGAVFAVKLTGGHAVPGACPLPPAKAR